MKQCIRILYFPDKEVHVSEDCDLQDMSKSSRYNQLRPSLKWQRIALLEREGVCTVELVCANIGLMLLGLLRQDRPRLNRQPEGLGHCFPVFEANLSGLLFA